MKSFASEIGEESKLKTSNLKRKLIRNTSFIETLIILTYLNLSSKKHFIDELKHLEYVFEKYHNFHKWIIDQLLNEVQMEDSNISSSMQENQNGVNKIAHVLVVTRSGSKDEKLIKSLKNSLKCVR